MNIVKTIKANWRELLSVVFLNLSLIWLIEVLSDSGKASNEQTALWATVAIVTLQSIIKFSTACALGWFGLALTFPEANSFIVSKEFDSWESQLTSHQRALISLVGVAVLIIVGAICTL